MEYFQPTQKPAPIPPSPYDTEGLVTSGDYKARFQPPVKRSIWYQKIRNNSKGFKVAFTLLSTTFGILFGMNVYITYSKEQQLKALLKERDELIKASSNI